jgi:hypothetical protein
LHDAKKALPELEHAQQLIPTVVKDPSANLKWTAAIAEAILG